MCIRLFEDLRRACLVFWGLILVYVFVERKHVILYRVSIPGDKYQSYNSTSRPDLFCDRIGCDVPVLKPRIILKAVFRSQEVVDCKL